jgi:hypothetical protein
MRVLLIFCGLNFCGLWHLVHRDAGDHQPDTQQVLAGRELAKDDRADDGGEHREQGEHEGEARAGSLAMAS